MKTKKRLQQSYRSTPPNQFRMTKEPNPPSHEEWQRLPPWVQLRIWWWVWCSVHPGPPAPVHFAYMASLCMFILMPVMPLHPMAIPIVIGGGLCGGLLLMGGVYGRER